MGNVMDARRRILLNTPHIETASGGVANFKTDMIAPLKGCKVNFLPKQSGSGDPSPTNIRPISGWDGVSVTRCGKNLFDVNTYPLTTRYYVDGGNGALSTSSNNSATIDYVPIYQYAGQTLTLNKRASGSNPGIAFYDEDNVFVSGLRNNSSSLATWTFTVPSTAYYMRFSVNKNTATDVQIEVGSQSTPYESYTASTFPISWTQQGTVYGGYVDLVSGELWATYKKVDISTLGSFNKNTALTGVDRFTRSKPSDCKDNKDSHAASNMFSDVFKSVAIYDANLRFDVWVMSIFNGNIYFNTPSGAYSSGEDFRTAMSGVGFAYELASPVRYQLTPTQIKTLKGINNVYSNADSAEVKFWTH